MEIDLKELSGLYLLNSAAFQCEDVLLNTKKQANYLTPQWYELYNERGLL